MDKTDFLAIMNLALTDCKVIEPEIVGLMMVALTRTPEGSLTVQFGSNVDQGLVAEALYALGDFKAHRHKRKIT